MVTRKVLENVFSNEHVAVVEGHREVNECLFSQPFDHIFLTGSPQLGKVAMKAAANHLAKVTLELGGKSPCIIDKDANIEMATKRVAFGKVINSGQTCIAPDYIYIHKDVKQQFVDLFAKNIENFYPGGIEQSVEYPHIVSDKAMRRLVALLDCGTVIYGGKYDFNTRFFHPTLMENVSPQSELMQNEIFGPIFPIYEFEDINEVIKFVTSRPKPLALYYFTQSNHRAERMLMQTSSGGVCINDALMHIVNHNLPFGGVQNSGIGNYHGKFSYETFSHKKAVLKTSTLIDFFVKYPPFGKERIKWIKKIF
jgi:aldehyde dehydrogenase (NAD+)